MRSKKHLYTDQITSSTDYTFRFHIMDNASIKIDDNDVVDFHKMKKESTEHISLTYKRKPNTKSTNLKGNLRTFNYDITPVIKSGDFLVLKLVAIKTKNKKTNFNQSMASESSEASSVYDY